MGHWRNSDTTHCLESSRNGRYASHRFLLFCLLLMIGCSSCDRFGQEKSQDAGTPDEAVQKMPLPRHVEGTPAVVPEGATLEQKTAAPAVPEATKPGAPAAKQTSQPKGEGKSVATPAPGEKKQQLAKGGTLGQKGTAPAKGEAKGSVQENKVKATVVAQKQPDAEQAAARGVKKKAVAASGGRWTVVVGPYLLEETLAADLTKVRRTGLSASIQPTARKRTAMNRLFLAQFDDRAAAQAELDKLKRHTSDAFILEHAGKHAVYAGSYLLDSRAASEKDRLAAAGFNLTLQRSDVAIPSKRLVVGTYCDPIAAENVQKKLKGAGLKGTLVHH